MKYKRVLLKLSGQMLGDQGSGFSYARAERVSNEIKSIYQDGIQISILVGGGNIMRARDAEQIDRLSADFMGMTGTIINALGLKSALMRTGIDARIMSAVNLEGVTERIVVDRAIDYMKDGKIVIFAGGTGAPYVTTDTAAALRALEIRADILLKATRVAGVFDSDPEKNPEAKKFTGLTFDDALKKDLKIMDTAAFSLLKENKLGLIVFNFLIDGNLKKVINGDKIGTSIT